MSGHEESYWRYAEDMVKSPTRPGYVARAVGDSSEEWYTSVQSAMSSLRARTGMDGKNTWKRHRASIDGDGWFGGVMKAEILSPGPQYGEDVLDLHPLLRRSGRIILQPIPTVRISFTGTSSVREEFAKEEPWTLEVSTNEDELFIQEEVAHVLGVSHSMVSSLVKSGILHPRSEINGRRYFSSSREELQKEIDTNRAAKAKRASLDRRVVKSKPSKVEVRMIERLHENGWEPDEGYPGSSRTPWRMRCMKCGRRTRRPVDKIKPCGD